MNDELPLILDFMFCSDCPQRFSCCINPAYCPDIDDMKEKCNEFNHEKTNQS